MSPPDAVHATSNVAVAGSIVMYDRLMKMRAKEKEKGEKRNELERKM